MHSMLQNIFDFCPLLYPKMLSKSVPRSCLQSLRICGQSFQAGSTLGVRNFTASIHTANKRYDQKSFYSTENRHVTSPHSSKPFIQTLPFTANSPSMTEQEVAEMKMKNVVDAIEAFNKSNFNSPGAVDALHKARMGNLRLSMHHMALGISACGLSNRDIKTFELAFWAFNVLKSEGATTTDTFESMMTICSKYGRVDSAAALMRDYFAQGFTYTSYMMSTYIIIIANSGSPTEVKELLHPLYATYKDLSNQKHFKISTKVFMSVAECHCRMGNSEGALTVLRDLTEINHEPSAHLCEPLLDCALSAGDTAVLRVLLNWYKTNFNIALLNGQSRRILHISASVGDGQLALMGFQMLRDANFEPTSSDYCCLLRALLLSRDLASATEVLQEMARQGVDFTLAARPSTPSSSSSSSSASVDAAAAASAASGSTAPSVDESTRFHSRQYTKLRHLLVDAIAGPKEADVSYFHRTDAQIEEGRALLDGLYYALVESVRIANVERAALSSNAVEGGEGAAAAPVPVPAASTPPVPRLVLDAVVEAAGKLFLPDRPFAVFQEYESLFQVAPDINSYNALLAACAAQRKIDISVVFAIFQEMESAGITANEESFTILLNAMTVCREYDIFYQVIEHMLSHKVLVPRNVLNSMALCLARSGQHWDLVELVKHLIIAERAGVPVESLSPLQNIAETIQLAKAADKRKVKDHFYRVTKNIEDRINDIKAEQDAYNNAPRGYH